MLVKFPLIVRCGISCGLFFQQYLIIKSLVQISHPCRNIHFLFLDTSIIKQKIDLHRQKFLWADTSRRAQHHQKQVSFGSQNCSNLSSADVVQADLKQFKSVIDTSYLINTIPKMYYLQLFIYHGKCVETSTSLHVSQQQPTLERGVVSYSPIS